MRDGGGYREHFSNRRVVGGGDNEETTPPPRLNLLGKLPSGSTADPAVVPPTLVLPVAHGGTARRMER